MLSVKCCDTRLNSVNVKLVNVVSGVPHSSVSGPLSFVLYTSELFYILENKLIGYADDSTLMAECHPQALEIQ